MAGRGRRSCGSAGRYGDVMAGNGLTLCTPLYTPAFRSRDRIRSLAEKDRPSRLCRTAESRQQGSPLRRCEKFRSDHQWITSRVFRTFFGGSFCYHFPSQKILLSGDTLLTLPDDPKVYPGHREPPTIGEENAWGTLYRSSN